MREMLSDVCCCGRALCGLPRCSALEVLAEYVSALRGRTLTFDVHVGCPQGGQESLCLFNYYFDYVLKVAVFTINEALPEGWGIGLEFNIPHMCTNREHGRCGKMGGAEMRCKTFCKTVLEAEQLLSSMKHRKDLASPKPTRVFNDEDLSEKPTLFSIDDQVVANVRGLTYLGQLIKTTEKGCYTAKFNELQSALTDNIVNLRTR